MFFGTLYQGQWKYAFDQLPLYYLYLFVDPGAFYSDKIIHKFDNREPIYVNRYILIFWEEQLL